MCKCLTFGEASGIKGKMSRLFSGTAGSIFSFRSSCLSWSIRGKRISSNELYFIYHEDEFCHYWLNFSTWSSYRVCLDIPDGIILMLFLWTHFLCELITTGEDWMQMEFPGNFCKSDSRPGHHWYHTRQNHFKASLKEKESSSILELL